MKLKALVLVAGLLWVGSEADETRANRSTSVRTQLVGAKLNPDLPNFRKFDARQGYYLVRYSDGAGRALSTAIYLFPDPAKNRGYSPLHHDARQATSTQNVELPSVRTGWGVNIGDTPGEVREKLGRAPDYASYSRQTRRGIYGYQEPIRLYIKLEKREVTWQYTAKYIFDKGQLRVIEYEAREQLPPSYD